MPNEIELKLRIATADIPRLRRHPALKQHLAGKPVTRKLVSIYYDTPELYLLDAAISLRVRRMSGGWFQAVKGAGYSLGGLHQRMEWEDIIAKGEPDFTKLTKITEPGLARLFADQPLRDELKPVFTTDVQRTEWQLAYADGSAVEVALDLGELRTDALATGNKREPITEVELELKHGDARHLFELALDLQADIPLHIENISKAQRGYGYYRSLAAKVSKAQEVKLNADISPHEAFAQIAGECLRQLQSNQDVAAQGDDAEGVHQMRVAVRRLRGAIKCFKHEIGDLQDELCWLNGRLAAAREWDVLLQETLPAAQTQENEQRFDALKSSAQLCRSKTYQQLRRALNSQRYQRLLLKLGLMLTTEYVSRQSLPKLAKKILQKGQKKLLAQSDCLMALSPAQRHKIRIQVKHMRYMSEFFQTLHDHKKSFAVKLTDAQDALGRLNDIAVTQKLVQSLTNTPGGSEIKHTVADHSIDDLLRWNHSRLDEMLQRADQAWRALLKTLP